MRFKQGVKWDFIKCPSLEYINPILKAAERLWSEEGQECVVTSFMDGVHSEQSLHYEGKAVDLRTRYFPENVAEDLVWKLQCALGEDYDVVWHSTHIHAEYDPN